jgi:co-chaperonin GroES (HSP10)
MPEKNLNELAYDVVNPRKVHPCGTWVLVRADPRVKKTAGGIVLPDKLVGVERVMEGTGTVLRVGKKVKDVKAKERVAFRGFLKDVTADIFMKEEDCDVFLIKEEDILAIIGPGITMGAFSSVQA